MSCQSHVHIVGGVSSLQASYVRRVLALFYLLDPESEAYIPVLRDKVMMGATSAKTQCLPLICDAFKQMAVRISVCAGLA